MAKVPLHHLFHKMLGPMNNLDDVRAVVKALRELPPDTEINLSKFAESAGKKSPILPPQKKDEPKK